MVDLLQEYQSKLLRLKFGKNSALHGGKQGCSTLRAAVKRGANKDREKLGDETARRRIRKKVDEAILCASHMQCYLEGNRRAI